MKTSIINKIKGCLHDLDVEIQDCEYIGINELQIQTVRDRTLELNELIDKLITEAINKP